MTNYDRFGWDKQLTRCGGEAWPYIVPPDPIALYTPAHLLFQTDDRQPDADRPL